MAGFEHRASDRSVLYVRRTASTCTLPHKFLLLATRGAGTYVVRDRGGMERCTLLLVVLAWHCTSEALQIEQPKAPPVFDETCGVISSVGVQWDGRWSPQQSTPSPLPGVAEEILATGAQWVRYPVQWAAVERSRGIYDWSAADAWLLGMHRAEQLGASRRGRFRLLLSLITSGAGTVPGQQRRVANPLYDGGDSPHSRAAVLAYARFVASAVSHFRQRHNGTLCVELDNEPDGNWQHHGQRNLTNGQKDGGEYGRMATVAARAVRQAYPSTCIVGGALTSWRCSPTNHTGDQNCAFLTGILDT